ncbi:MAG: ABC transporter ATP-binding protein [Gemmatimonadota bacterium]
MSEAPGRRLREELGAQLSNGAWALGRAWEESRMLLSGLAVSMLVRGLLPAALALTLKALIDAVAEPGVGADEAAVLGLVVAIFLLALLEGLSWFGERYLSARLRDDLDLRISVDVLEHASKMSLTYIEDPAKRDLIDRARANPGTRVALLVKELRVAVTMGLQAVSLFGVLIAIEPLVAVVVPLVAVPFLFFQWRLGTRRYLEQHERVTRARWSWYYSDLALGPYSASETRLLDLGPLLVDRYRGLLDGFRRRDGSLHRQDFFGSSIATILLSLGLYGLFALVTLDVLNGTGTIGDLAIFTGAAARLRSSVDQAIRSVSTALEHSLFVADLREFLDTAPALEHGAETFRPVPGSARVSVEDVSFAYPNGTAVLDGVSFEMRPGETVALVGENGAGKTTLAKLIAGLYPPAAGTIRWQGVDLRDIDPGDLHEHVSFIFQRFGRYEGTVTDNIAFGDWRQLLSRPDEVREIAGRAGVDSIAEALPDGFDTVLGRLFGTVSLSGGQWQQLALARGLARESSLIILDEPTANLDPRAEYELFTRFKQLAAGRTALIVSHRFSTIAMADRIVVLSEGRVIEDGSHDQLLGLGGTYAALYELHRQRLPDAP